VELSLAIVLQISLKFHLYKDISLQNGYKASVPNAVGSEITLQHYSPTTMKGYFAKPITSHL
jgi:hypothetical protein